MESYSHIIVGAGSAGCVLAWRLSEQPENRVLLLEAGPPDRHPFIRMPKAVTELLKRPRYTWAMEVDRGLGNSPEIWMRGRTLGGSSSVNGMMYTRGQLEDFDGWEAMGNPGWGRADMLRAYQGLEKHELGESDLHGAAGNLRISLHDENTPVFDTLIAAMQSEGMPMDRDMGTTGNPGAGFMPRNIHKGRRFSAADAFLKPARNRPNLEVVTGVEVECVLFVGKRAAGVVARRDGRAVTYRSNGEVILSAGALHSPKLLMLSGIGPAAELRSLGIAPLVDSPNVGKRLREHMMTYTYFRFARSFGYTRDLQGWRVLLNGLKYYLTRRGLMSWTPMEIASFFKTDPALPRADALVTISPVLVNFDPKGKPVLSKETGVTAFSYFLRPESEGAIRLTGKSPSAPLHIEPGYLSAPQDAGPTLAAFRALRRMFASAPLADYDVAEVGPVAGLESDDDLLAYMRRGGGKAAFHAVGTCRMGPAEDDVVDPELKVRGVEGLRVVDVSVLPTLPQHTNGPAMAVGWRGSDFILDCG